VTGRAVADEAQRPDLRTALAAFAGEHQGAHRKRARVIEPFGEDVCFGQMDQGEGQHHGSLRPRRDMPCRKRLHSGSFLVPAQRVHFKQSLSDGMFRAQRRRTSLASRQRYIEQLDV
jgi:hypothetical protein